MNKQRVLKNGLSGIMRVKNEGRFLEACIDSCVEALDEIIIVYTGCTDNTEEILNRKKKEYPTKLKIYHYEYDVLWFNLNRDEFEYALDLPDDSPLLYSNLCNYSLSKVNYKYVVKIDADQLYFQGELKKWRDVCAENKVSWKLTFVIGYLFMAYFSLYRRLSSRIGYPILKMLPNWLISLCRKSYIDFTKWQLIHDKAVVALSGLNLFKDSEWYVPFDGYNIHPPYNGEGDTVIFKVSHKTYYSRSVYDKSIKKMTYSVTEDFNMPKYKMMFAGPVWFHQHANRYHCCEKVKKVKDKYPELFIPINDFVNMSYLEIHNKMNKKSHSLYQRTLFAIVHKMGIDIIKKNIPIINKSGI